MYETEPKPTIQLTNEQIEFYHSQGYLALPAITTQEEVAWAREKYDEMFKKRVGRETGNQFDLAGTDEEGKEAKLPQILNPELYYPEFRNTLMRANAAAITKQLLGEKAVAAGAHAIFKPAKIGAATPWHQDEAYWDASMEYQSISIWVPLQQATIDNGCMWFVPGSHTWEIKPHHHINNDPRIHGLELDNPEPLIKNAVACPLPPGGCTIHPSTTLHYTGPNISDIPRRAYILGGSLPAKKRAIPRRFPWIEEEATAAGVRRKAAQTAAAAK